MKLLIPFVPHLARECLSNLNVKNVHNWPTIDKKKLDDVNINMVIQVNGKTRDVISVKKDEKEDEIKKISTKSNKIKKYLIDKKISKTIFVKNKIINYIIGD